MASCPVPGRIGEEKVAATDNAEPTRAGLHRRTLAPSAVE
jgi:hypothetical protein